MTYEELVQKAKDIYEGVDASNINEHIAFQFDVRGEGEGAFYMEVEDGKVKVEPYEYYDHDALITTSQENLLLIATGQVDPIQAFFSGKIKVEGDLGKAARLKELSDAAVELAKKVAEEEAAKGVEVPAAPKKRRPRRTKEEIEAEKAAKAAAKAEREAAKAAKEAEKAAKEAEKAAEASAAPKKRGRRPKAEIEAAKAAEVAKAAETEKAVEAAKAAETEKVAKAAEASVAEAVEEIKAVEETVAAEEAKAPAKRKPGRPKKNA